MDPEIAHLHEHDHQIKVRVRRIRVLIRALDFACSVVVVALMGHNLVTFYNTANTVSQGQKLWPDNPKLWPTYLMLAVASISTFLATIVLLAYFWGTRAANRWNQARFGLTIFTIVFMIIMWAIAAGGVQSNSGDETTIWGVACDATSDTESLFGHSVNFRQTCLMQEWSIICAGIGIGLEILTIVSYVYVYLRLRHKKAMKQRVTVYAPQSPQGYQGGYIPPSPSAYPPQSPPGYRDQRSPQLSPYFDAKQAPVPDTPKEPGY